MVMMTDDPQQCPLLFHAVTDEQLHRGKRIARGEVLVESQDVIL